METTTTHRRRGPGIAAQNAAAPRRMLLLVTGRWWLVGLLCVAVGAACGDTSSGSSSGVSAVRGVAVKGHLVAVAYRAFGAAQQDCQNKFNAGVLKTDAEGATCIDDGLTASKLEDSIETLRTQIVSVGLSGSADCKAAAQRLASVVQQEETSIHALHGDLENLDAQSFNHDFEHAAATAGHEGSLNDVLVHTCT